MVRICARNRSCSKWNSWLLYFPCTLPNTFYCPCSPSPTHSEPSWPASDDSQQLERGQAQRVQKKNHASTGTLPNPQIFSKCHLAQLLRMTNNVTDKKLTGFQCKNKTPLCRTCKKRNRRRRLSVVKTPVWELAFNRTLTIKKKSENEAVIWTGW